MPTATWAPLRCRWVVAIFPDHASEPAAIVKAADVALYHAKSGGRNRVVMFTANAEQSDRVVKLN